MLDSPWKAEWRRWNEEDFDKRKGRRTIETWGKHVGKGAEERRSGEEKSLSKPGSRLRRGGHQVRKSLDCGTSNVRQRIWKELQGI